MDNKAHARELLQASSTLHTLLIEKARALARFNELLSFTVDCITFAETYFPEKVTRQWMASSPSFAGLSAIPIPTSDDPGSGLVLLSPYMNTTGSSASSDAFAFVLSNIKYIEDDAARNSFALLTGTYHQLLTSDEESGRVHAFLVDVSPDAAGKFSTARVQFASTPTHEDPQGPLSALRSSLEIALRALLSRTPLTAAQIADLRKRDWIPTIAQYLSNDEVAKTDLILGSQRFMELWGDLSSAKQESLPRDAALALAVEVTGLLNLMARTLESGPQSA